ncbi:ribosomal RNA small subunit methyltransferase B [Dulcicalothrix desertica PCC 7102]|uniref:16S rRNA (cytosine(967)-C(5))-methyltransferase n=1 Tax=Dulcicalothrix desertica PCC 7102 TaxID=232991 RepID=A0A3S1CMN8_9CYAN|nr:16S rRNA (cytosine(967)-C(5))-methyltransferase [Dulcicalothrix desertica]RUT06726.1 ribosomal RNA small subunit methyltransferase B [Dulcicalothrix desertica PCC 7102]TWH50166.1 16S rRNA (cytosine967-C5)-methyltransferase [Dulcicalothrix desertica PCC 7102]
MFSARQIAFIALRDVHKGAFVDVALDRALQKYNSKSSLADNERRLVTELVYGCVRRQRTLDYFIDVLGKKKAHQQPKDLRTILHIGLYQLMYQDRIPASAAVNTTVELAKDNGFVQLAPVVNGMLRSFIREGEKQKGEGLGVLYSFPDWIIDVWVKQFGEEETEKLCQWMNQTPTIDLRVNLLRATIREVETAFYDSNIKYEKLTYLPQALRLIGSNGAIQNLPGYEQGWWSVQDSSAQLVAHLLDPQPGEVIIDACAAPGGKTTHIAELMGDEGKIWACDRTASRLRKLEENARRLQLKSIEIFTGDSRSLREFINSADRVLVDAPCSGLGTLHRHADARWRQTPESVEELAVLQRELLSNTAKYVKPGGVLVYATCTLHPLENETVIESFLVANPNWEIEAPSINSFLNKYIMPQGWLKVVPHQHNMDGFFMTRLRKSNNSQ